MDFDLQPGAVVGEYVVEGKLGQGGFGTVWRASHAVIGKLAAIKVLAPQYSADPDMVSRFMAEARAVNQIRHRGIIDIFGFGKLDDGRSYYVMELLEGAPLSKVIDETGGMPLGDALPILRGIAHALDAAHGKSIAHRDLKPDNVFIAAHSDGTQTPKLLDFGIAKLVGTPSGDTKHRTATGAPIGTPCYMSPEQCRGRDVDHRTDVYAFGCVAYELLTGQVPFDGEDHVTVLFKQINDDAVPVSVRVAENAALPPIPAGVDEVIAWLLQKDPAARPPDLMTAVQALEDAATAAGIPVAPPMRPSGRITPVAMPIARAASHDETSGRKVTPFEQASTMASSEPLASAMTMAPAAGNRRFGWIVAACAALAAVIVVFALRGGDEPAAVTPAPPAAAQPAPPPAPPAPTPIAIPVPTVVTVPAPAAPVVVPPPVAATPSKKPKGGKPAKPRPATKPTATPTPPPRPTSDPYGRK